VFSDKFEKKIKQQASNFNITIDKIAIWIVDNRTEVDASVNQLNSKADGALDKVQEVIEEN
jgi:hypothetical protein